MSSAETVVADDRREHARLAAELLARAIQSAVEERGVARIAVSGGSTPADAYRHLGGLSLPWAQTEWFWVDERAVSADSERSNYGRALADLRLLENGVPSESIHRMEADDADREAAALRYERTVRASFGVAARVAFDAVTLGIGEDGHTASLFPGVEVPLKGEPRHPVDIDDRLVASVAAPGGLEARLTLTAPVLLEARLLLVLCRGEGKRAIVQAARAPGDVHELPARIFSRARGKVVWVLDGEAAGESQGVTSSSG